MNLLESLNRVLLEESVSADKVNDAINNKYRVIINYHTKGEDVATGPRIIEVYAYGMTKAGNPVMRAFQPYGDTTTRVPSWKFFRLDRVSYWKPTGQKFTEPASDYYPNLGNFNPNGDNSMSIVYNIAKFGGKPEPELNIPKKEQPSQQDVYKTDTEKNMNRLRQQLANPIYMSNLKDRNSLSTKQQQQATTPNNGQITIANNDIADKQRADVVQMNQPVQQRQQNVQNSLTNQPSDANLYKTDTEKNLERLRQQLANPRRVDQSVLDRYNREKNNRLNRSNRRR